MAGHSRPRLRHHRRTAAQAAGVLTLAGVATALGSVSQAEPRLSVAEVKARVDALHHDAEVATERYHAARERAQRSERRIERLQDQAARRQQELNEARGALGGLAAEQYRTGGLGPAMRLALSASPEEYLARAEVLRRAGDRQAVRLNGIGHRLRELRQLRGEAEREQVAYDRTRDALRTHKKTVEAKLAEAQRLLNTLAPVDRSAITAEHGAPAAANRDFRRGELAAPRGGAQAGPDGAGAAPSAPAASSPAATAVSYAMAQIGKPYVWGATGPSAFDCSGLTQAAWEAAGVALPRTTFTQINAGQRVSRSQLVPGDLVFFYSSVSHVGMYIGNGQMVHAPRPGSSIRTAPVDLMPFAGAVRPA
ncbi:NlpC/P60 family protein [Streptomyces polyrhachis]|uniref:NlpC/P60 family protein n=1 Tax=Streptomyces polyrhachis TaxID=1282885 RepID=A0ABW2GNR9_9ACTN